MGWTAVNVGNSLATIVIAKWVGKFDPRESSIRSELDIIIKKPTVQLDSWFFLFFRSVKRNEQSFLSCRTVQAMTKRCCFYPLKGIK